MLDTLRTGELVRVKDTGHLGVIVKDGVTTAKIHWIYPKWSLVESWVHYDRLEVLCKQET